MNQPQPSGGTNSVALFFAWLWVGIPLAWGIWVTIGNVAKLFAPPAS
jgi:hypothetical protein